MLAHLVAPGVKVHDEVLGLGVPVPDLALVAVRVPGHPLRHISVVLVLGDQLVILIILRGGTILQRRPQYHGRLAGPEMPSQCYFSTKCRISFTAAHLLSAGYFIALFCPQHCIFSCKTQFP